MPSSGETSVSARFGVKKNNGAVLNSATLVALYQYRLIHFSLFFFQPGDARRRPGWADHARDDPGELDRLEETRLDWFDRD